MHAGPRECMRRVCAQIRRTHWRYEPIHSVEVAGIGGIRGDQFTAAPPEGGCRRPGRECFLNTPTRGGQLCRYSPVVFLTGRLVQGEDGADERAEDCRVLQLEVTGFVRAGVLGGTGIVAGQMQPPRFRREEP